MDQTYLITWLREFLEKEGYPKHIKQLWAGFWFCEHSHKQMHER